MWNIRESRPCLKPLIHPLRHAIEIALCCLQNTLVMAVSLVCLHLKQTHQLTCSQQGIHYWLQSFLTIELDALWSSHIWHSTMMRLANLSSTSHISITHQSMKTVHRAILDHAFQQLWPAIVKHKILQSKTIIYTSISVAVKALSAQEILKGSFLKSQSSIIVKNLRTCPNGRKHTRRRYLQLNICVCMLFYQSLPLEDNKNSKPEVWKYTL